MQNYLQHCCQFKRKQKPLGELFTVVWHLTDVWKYRSLCKNISIYKIVSHLFKSTKSLSLHKFDKLKKFPSLWETNILNKQCLLFYSPRGIPFLVSDTVTGNFGIRTKNNDWPLRFENVQHILFIYIYKNFPIKHFFKP